MKALVASKGLKDKFAEIVTDFDRDRVHDSDVKKLFTWYNILIGAGFVKFTKEEEKKEEADTEAAAE